MPTYALLGATGSTGAAILRCLLRQPPKDLKLNIFVRSKPKLLKQFPDLERSTPFDVQIIEATPDDSVALQNCLNNADVVMACIATNESTPGISLAYDTATAITSALETHRKDQGSSYKTPTVIQLRSASLNPVMKANSAWLGRTMAAFCFHYIYADLERACNLFIAASESHLLDYIFVDPPSIHDPDGTTPTGYKLTIGDGKHEPAMSYADLGVAFCEVAERRREFAGRGVGVTATGHVNLTWGVLSGYIFQGAKSRIWG
ncbi:uncharacterized protein LTR77_002051 [Saxophila tyrrhenica]|uniref:NAD(P)-binding domain-containing protein n=1 Tax=Saxophila tyrrhenica TaxID=1690608 RepID=A0AAV9PKY7_9PEZI|nr:hypothetical protein LTR77_002051 [Saxophila tyrrhenica]